MRICCTLIFILFFGISFGQFTGGIKDGHASQKGLSSTSIYFGGASNGYGSNELINTVTIYLGGNKDGYASSSYSSAVSIYSGSIRDGYSSSNLSSGISIYTGSTKDGYANSTSTSGVSIYSGGQQDGYALGEKILSFIWIGVVNENWNNAGNWQTSIIPNINSNVVIPAQVPNYPVLNNGLMSIGLNPNGGLFLCKQIRIKQGAQMTYTSTGFLENYGLMDIRGIVYGNNYAADAFVIKSGGILNIVNQGSLIF